MDGCALTMSTLRQAEILELPGGIPTRPVPPLAAVRAFEAATRLQSFSRAAQELNMSPAAVSYQIKQLEARVGLTLFQRLPRKVVLTRAGEQLAPAVLEAFKLLQGAFATLAERAVGELAITALPTFASSWLVQRLGRFKRMQPGLHLRLDISVPLVDLDLGAFDVSIRSGSGDWAGMESHFLFPDICTPLLSPALIARIGGLRAPRALDGLLLMGCTAKWRTWLDHTAPDAFDLTGRTGIDFGIEHHDVTVAIAGDGVALASPLLFAHEIATGQLLQPFAETVDSSGGYWLAYPKVNARTPKIKAFTRWIASEARDAFRVYTAQRAASSLR